MRKVKWILMLITLCILLILPCFLSCTPIAKPPKLAMYPLQLNLSIVKGEDTDNKSIDSIYISNLGDGEMQWSVNQDSSWLTIKPESGICGTENTTVKVIVNEQANLLEEGNYATICKFTDVKDSTNFDNVAVNLVIKPPLFKTYIDPLDRFSFKYPPELYLPPQVQYKNVNENTYTAPH